MPRPKQFERFLVILSLIPEEPERISIAQLLDKLMPFEDIDLPGRRSMERDLNMMAASPYIPIQGDGSKPQGWSFHLSGHRPKLPPGVGS